MISWRMTWLLVWGLGGLGCSKKEPPKQADPVTPPSSVSAESAPPPPSPVPSAPSGRSTELFNWGGVPRAIASQRGASSALSAEVLRALFPRHLPGLDRCPDAPGTLEQARAQGLVVPQIASHASGAFSRAGASEQLLGVLVGECGATHADGWGSRRLVLWAEGKILRDTALQGRLAGAVDLDGDGRMEVLLESGGTGQGITTTSLAVARLEAQGAVVIADFGVVYEGNCGAQRPEGEEVSVVTAVARGGAALDFDLRKEKRPCR